MENNREQVVAVRKNGDGDIVAEMAQIHGLIAFFNERTDIEVDGVAAKRPTTVWA